MPDQSYLGECWWRPEFLHTQKWNCGGMKHTSQYKFESNNEYAKFARFVRDKQSN